MKEYGVMERMYPESRICKLVTIHLGRATNLKVKDSICIISSFLHHKHICSIKLSLPFLKADPPSDNLLFHGARDITRTMNMRSF